jgi:Cu(I)/Ag(I) efflux system membrane fusion protein
MDPSVVSATPAKDAMGMDYVPVYADELSAGDITLAPALVQKLGARTEEVQHGVLPLEIRAPATLQYDERSFREILTRGEAWIENLAVDSAGQSVRAGQLLFEVYSPRLETAEQEFLNSLQFADEQRTAIAERRLLELGIEPAFIARLRESRQVPHLIPFHAHRNGVVVELNVRQGALVATDTVIMRLASLETVWAIVELPQAAAVDLTSSAADASVAISVDAFPGRSFAGRLQRIDPQIDATRRIIRARAAVENRDLVLRPGMTASVVLQLAPGAPVVHVPTSAVVREGGGDHVLLALGDGRFSVRQVRLGRQSAARVAVLDGLKPGDRVVTNGLFMLDSEAQVRAGLARIDHRELCSPAAAGTRN